MEERARGGVSLIFPQFWGWSWGCGQRLERGNWIPAGRGDGDRGRETETSEQQPLSGSPSLLRHSSADSEGERLHPSLPPGDADLLRETACPRLGGGCVIDDL